MAGNISPDNFMKCCRFTILNAFLKSILRSPILDPLCKLRASRREWDTTSTHAVILASEGPDDLLFTRTAETFADEATDRISASQRANRSCRFLKGYRYPTCHKGHREKSGAEPDAN